MRNLRWMMTLSLVSGVAALVGFLVGGSGRLGGVPMAAVQAESHRSSRADLEVTGRARPGGAALTLLSLPVASASAGVDDDRAVGESQARMARAAHLLGGVFDQLDAQARRGIAPAEARAGMVLPYLSGVLKGALQADPALRSAFAAQFTAALCDRDRDLADDRAISLAQMALGYPDMASEQAFECFFARAKEDVPLWSMLDAWRRSGLGKTPAIARLEASATDSRTTRRFSSPETALAQRAGLAAAALGSSLNQGDRHP